MAGDDPDLTLYRLHGCPYCERVVRALDDRGLDYRSRFVPGEHSRRDAVKRVSGSRGVPVLVDRERGVTMPESGRIVEYIERTYGDGVDRGDGNDGVDRGDGNDGVDRGDGTGGEA